jgi:dipeptidyl aminopeptidase/acylaminoacyl peptidase
MVPPISAAMVARSHVVAEPRFSPTPASGAPQSRLAWVDAFAARSDLVVAPVEGSGPPAVVTADVGAASVGAYGGGVYCWAGEGRLVYAARDGRLMVVAAAGGPPRVLHEGGRASAPAVSPDGSRVAFVVERDDSCEIVIVHIDGHAGGSADPVTVSTGADYSFDPAWSPDGRLVVWHEWNFPAMPWDESHIVMRELDGGRVTVVAGGKGVATGQPRFAPDGSALAYVSDATGWMNVWVAAPDGSDARPLLAEAAEHAEPTWGPGQRSYAWAPDGREIVLCRNEQGFGRLVLAQLGGGAARDVSRGWHHGLDWSPAGLTCIRSGARTPPSVVLLDPHAPSTRRSLARGPVAGFEAAGLVEPEPVTWPNDGADVHGLLWRPPNPAHEPPPLLVMVHGGPHGQATASWMPRVAYFLVRGWAVLSPNARGSTGYGRDYAQALAGGWGETDLDDVVAGIDHARRAGWCDPSRVAAMGGSAGGFTVLQLALCHGELLRAAVSLYGVTDLFDLASTTHRFESRYLDRIVGLLPDDAARYRDRSPITHAAKASIPLLMLQGDQDVAVPKAQADALVEKMREHGGAVEYHVYEGEGHGWSRPETIEDELRRVESFLSRQVLAP